ncbi:MAG: PIN domain-containing protein [Acidobacteria bacterium]|nr:PIN domain-containing protein [Acidobacteriota bacterium]
MILVDAGPLVALLDRDDQHHAACAEAFKTIDEPLATVWPAFTEAMYLLHDAPNGPERLWDFAEEVRITFLQVAEHDNQRIRELMQKYNDRQMDLADATLVCVAEREGLDQIFTVERTDFTVYRLNGHQRFQIIP